MLSFESPNFRRALEETAAWCALLSMGRAHVDAEIVAQRRVADQELSDLMQKARTKANRTWFQGGVTDTDEWQRASILLKRIRDFLNPLRHSFRSPDLKPNFDFDGSQTNQAWEDAIAQTVAKRSALLIGNRLRDDAYDVRSGRLLLYNPEENLACGGAELSSHGFFDVNNVPAWDLWVAFSERTLVSWIPSQVVETAQRGVDANPEACINWAD
jgi:hypothetical protein